MISGILRQISAFFPVCFVKHFTGLPCPTCGSTRAVIAYSEGEFWDGFLFNPLLTILAVFSMGWGGWYLYRRRTGGKTPSLFEGSNLRLLRWGLVIGIVLNWVYLISAGV